MYYRQEHLNIRWTMPYMWYHWKKGPPLFSLIICQLKKSNKYRKYSVIFFIVDHDSLIVWWLCDSIRMNLGKPNAHRRQNSGTFWSIARDRQFDLESENVHRSSEHPSPGRMIVLYVVSDEKKEHLIKRITGWLQTEYQAKNMFRRFLILFTTQGRRYHGTSNIWNSLPYSFLSYNCDSKETSKI